MTHSPDVHDTDDAHGTVDAPNSVQIAGFWRRLVALAVDYGLLACVCTLLVSEFYAPLSRMGVWSVALGFLLTVAYGGLLNSRLNRGQTVGKWLLRIRTVSSNGENLSIPLSLIRTAILFLPFFLGRAVLMLSGTADVLAPESFVMPLYLLMDSTASPQRSAAVCLLWSLGAAIVYLYVANARTRQSVHDLVVGSHVVPVGGRRAVGPCSRLARGHLVVCAGIALATCTAGVFGLVTGRQHPAERSLTQAIAELDGVRYAYVRRVHVSGSQNTYAPPGLLVKGFHTPVPTAPLQVADRIAQRVLETRPGMASTERLMVVVVYGADLGMAVALRWNWNGASVAEWRERLGGSGADSASARDGA